MQEIGGVNQPVNQFAVLKSSCTQLRVADRGKGYLGETTMVSLSAIGTNKISLGSARMRLPVEGQVIFAPRMLPSHSGPFLSSNASRIVLAFGGPFPSTHAIGNE